MSTFGCILCWLIIVRLTNRGGIRLKLLTVSSLSPLKKKKHPTIYSTFSVKKQNAKLNHHTLCDLPLLKKFEFNNQITTTLSSYKYEKKREINFFNVIFFDFFTRRGKEVSNTPIQTLWMSWYRLRVPILSFWRYTTFLFTKIDHHKHP